MDATRWRRYGKDRLYVRDEGADVGWWDLATDQSHPASPDLKSALAEAVTAWRAATNIPLTIRMLTAQPSPENNIARLRHPPPPKTSTWRPRPQPQQHR